MSYAIMGLGGVSTPDFRHTLTATAALQNEAALSPFGRVGIVAVDIIAQAATGKANPLDVVAAISAPIAEKIGDIMSELVVDTIGETVDAIPLVGQTIGLIVDGFKAASALDQHTKDFYKKTCETRLSRLTPLKSGSKAGGCDLCPRDYFTKITGNERSALGQALMLITEGFVADPEDVGGGVPKYVAEWEKRIDEQYDFCLGMYDGLRVLHPSWPKITPLTKAQRRQFRTVRRGIEADSKTGGLTLWPAYLDLLLRASKEKQLSSYVALYMLTHNCAPSQKGSINGITGECANALIRQIWDINDGLIPAWKRTVGPAYVGGQKALDESTQKVREAVAKMQTAPAKKKPIPKKTTAKPMSPVLAIALGAGAAVGGVVLLKRALHKKRSVRT